MTFLYLVIDLLLNSFQFCRSNLLRNNPDNFLQLERWFCGFCIPFIDEWTAGAMVWWDERRRKRHFGKRPKKTKPFTKVERETQIRSAVVWCLMNGYPIKTEETEKGGQDNDRCR